MRKSYSAMLVGAGLLALSGAAAAAPHVELGFFFGAPAPVYAAPHAPVVRYSPPAYAAPHGYVEGAPVHHSSRRAARYATHDSYNSGSYGAYDRGSYGGSNRRDRH